MFFALIILQQCFAAQYDPLRSSLVPQVCLGERPLKIATTVVRRRATGSTTGRAVAVVAAEAARTLGSLALMGVRVTEMLVNQVLLQDDSYEYRNLPAHPAFDWYTDIVSLFL